MLMRARLAIVINKRLDDETNASVSHKLVFTISRDARADIKYRERTVTSYDSKD